MLRTSFVILGLCTLILCSSPSNAGCSDPDETVGSAFGLTPPPGDPARKAVLDALRSEMKRLHGLDLVFVVRHLRIRDNWAWVHTEPRSLRRHGALRGRLRSHEAGRRCLEGGGDPLHGSGQPRVS